jgi:hypothetical protein
MQKYTLFYICGKELYRIISREGICLGMPRVFPVAMPLSGRKEKTEAVQSAEQHLFFILEIEDYI